MRQLFAAFMLLFALSLSGQVFAHAALISSAPADGDVLATAPKSLSLTFTEPVSPLVLKLITPDGTATPLTDFTVRDTTVEIPLATAPETGTSVLSWRVVSEDGHPIGGSIVFSIGAPSVGGAPLATEAVDWSLRTAIWLTRAVLYAALFFGIGSLFFRIWIALMSNIKTSPSLALLLPGLIAAPLSIGLQGVDALALPLSALTNVNVWQTGFATSLGPAAAIAFCALVLAALSIKIRSLALQRILLTLALAGIGLSLASSGHASAANPQWLTRPAVFIHAVTIAFWTGALIPLIALLRDKSPAAVPTLQRFSTAIPFALAPLIAAGLILAIIQLQSVSALWQTPYGLVLLAKLALVVLAFLLALYNRLRLTTPTINGDTQSTNRLVRSITVETALILAVLLTAALWRFTPPPRVLAELAAIPAEVHIHAEKAMAEVTVSPGHTGPVSASIFLMTGDFGPLDPKALTLVLSNPKAGIEPFERQAKKQADGTWLVDDLTIPIPGAWTIRLDIRVSDFEMTKIEDQIEIRP
jgi:copper transport protein